MNDNCRSYIQPIVDNVNTFSYLKTWQFTLMIGNIVYFAIVWFIFGLYFLFSNEKKGYSWCMMLLKGLLYLGHGIITCFTFGTTLSFRNFLSPLVSKQCSDA
jgi:hypothetical protein